MRASQLAEAKSSRMKADYADGPITLRGAATAYKPQLTPHQNVVHILLADKKAQLRTPGHPVCLLRRGAGWPPVAPHTTAEVLPRADQSCRRCGGDDHAKIERKDSAH